MCSSPWASRIANGARELVLRGPDAVYIRSMPTLFEHAGGEQALHRLEQVFYDSVLADPLLQPLFGAGRPDHVDHLTAFTAESTWPGDGDGD